MLINIVKGLVNTVADTLVVTATSLKTVVNSEDVEHGIANTFAGIGSVGSTLLKGVASTAIDAYHDGSALVDKVANTPVEDIKKLIE